jgi:hypothetical protein
MRKSNTATHQEQSCRAGGVPHVMYVDHHQISLASFKKQYNKMVPMPA